MKEEKFIAIMILIWLLALGCTVALAEDARFCGVVYRDAITKKIIRSAAVKAAFKNEWPCIAPCDATWQVDHTLPLYKGGCDSVINMQWMPPGIKTCALVPGGAYCKDRWEGLVYGGRPVVTIFVTNF